MKRRTTWPFIAAFAVLSALLQLDILLNEKPMDVFRSHDETWYGVVLNRLETMDCERGLPVTFLFPERRGFHTCQYFKVLNRLSPFREAVPKVAFLKVSGRVVILGLYCLLCVLLLGSPWPGLFLGGLHFLDPGIHYFKPGVILLRDLLKGDFSSYLNVQNRFISPMHYLIPGFLGAIGYIVMILHPMRKGLLLVAGIVLLISHPLLSMTPYYTWLPFLFLFSCLWLYSLYFSALRIKLLIGATFTVLGALILFQTLRQHYLNVPYLEETLLRSGFIKNSFRPIYVKDFGLILGAAVSSGIAYRVFRRRKLPSILVGSGMYLLMNVNVLTGFEFQNFHFKDYLGPFVFSAAFLFAWHSLVNHRKWICGVSIALLVAGFISFYQCRTHNSVQMPYRLPDPEDHALLVQFAKDHLQGKKVYCNQWFIELPILANTQCSYYHLLGLYPISDEELLMQTMAHFKLLDFSAARVRKVLESEVIGGVINGWPFGHRPEWISAPRNGVGGPEKFLSEETRRRIAEKWATEYQRLPEGALLEEIQGYDYFILSERHPLVPRYFKLVQRFQSFGVYRLL